jgi:hypothetical protein
MSFNQTESFETVPKKDVGYHQGIRWFERSWLKADCLSLLTVFRQLQPSDVGPEFR